MTSKSQSTLTLRVHSPEVGYLNVRSQPTTAGALVTTVPHGGAITALEPEEAVRAKVGQHGQWLHVRLDDNREVYAAAWYLELLETAPETRTGASQPQQPTLQIWVYSPEAGYLNVRSQPTTASTLVTTVPHGVAVTALEPEEIVRAKVGQRGRWLHVRLDDNREVYAAAWYLKLSETAPDQPPAEQKITVTPNLSGTERQVALTWNRLGGLLQTWADQLAIDPGIAVAVLMVESGGRPFGPDGRMIIRFENHIFHSRWGKNHPGVFDRHFAFNRNQRWTDHRWRPSPGQPWRACHENQNGEWQVFDFACTLNDTAARLSISMGGPQIMGFNYAVVGYTSVHQMFDAFAASERNQVAGFFDFVRSRGEKAVRMLQVSDFDGFATLYNGPGQAATYSRLIRQAYEAYHRLRTISFGAPFKAPSGVTSAPLVEVDDFQRILGIGPKTTASLKVEGIHRFAQLAALDIEHLRGLLGSAAGRAHMLETWPAQARLAAWGDWDALKAFQAQLKSHLQISES